jgi:hypothetical protein
VPWKEQDIGIEETHGVSRTALVRVLLGQAVRCGEGLYLLPQCPLLALESLNVAFLRGQLQKETFDQRGDGRVLLGGLDTGAP